MSTIAYMFHAIGDLDKDDWADFHYSFSNKKFELLLKSLGQVSSIQNAMKDMSINSVIFTFDDGHISNYDAAKFMHENNYGTADFFINPDKVGSPFYMDWDQIAELDKWGMSIQSHGLDHKYLSDCDDVELHRQLLLSKQAIESKIGSKVSIIAPPGGRYDKRVIKISKLSGYKLLANSEPGNISNINRFLLPRMAVLNTHSVESLLCMRNRYSLLNIKNIAKYNFLYLVKKLLGNVRYERIRWYLLGEQ